MDWTGFLSFGDGMLIKSLKAWRRHGHFDVARALCLCLLACVFVSGCTTVCLEPEDLCASGNANTSLHGRAGPLTPPVAPPVAPLYAPAPEVSAPAVDAADAIRT